MKKAYIDFETYFDDDVSVVTQGNDNYIANASAYIVAAAVEGEDIDCGTLVEMAPKLSRMARDPELEFWAANSNFDQQWFEKYFGPTRNPWRCALDLAAFHQLPRNLKGFAKQTLGVEMDKTIRDEMRGVHYEDLSPEEQIAMQHYCAQDVALMAQAIDAVAPMTAVEARIAEYTRRSNRRGILMDMDRVKADRKAIEEAQHDAFFRVPWNQDAPLGSPKALQDWCATNGIPAPSSRAKTDEYCNQLMREHPKLAEVMTDLRMHNKANVMFKKIDALIGRVRPDNILPTDLMFCGAPHTRRWSSRGFNIQNLEKAGTEFGDRVVNPRNWIVPRPGKTFLILDFAQIEPRCLNWLADNTAMLDAMRAGFNYYEAYLVYARNWTGAKGTLKKELKAAHGDDWGKQYTLIKNECLGCGYGMGWERFVSYAAERGVVVTDEEAKAVINSFRTSNKSIVKLWRQMDSVIRQAAANKSKEFELEMPSGDMLKYFHIRSHKGGYKGYVIRGDFGQQSEQPRLWGGTLTENICQRMSRDMMAEGILRCEGAGMAVPWTVHDELILEVDKDNKEEAKTEAIRLLTQAPEWASDLPLAVDGGFADMYTKLD